MASWSPCDAAKAFSLLLMSPAKCELASLLVNISLSALESLAYAGSTAGVSSSKAATPSRGSALNPSSPTAGRAFADCDTRGCEWGVVEA